MSGRDGRLEVHDLPGWLVLVMLVTQSMLGFAMGVLLSRVVKRTFLTGYAILGTKQ